MKGKGVCTTPVSEKSRVSGTRKFFYRLSPETFPQRVEKWLLPIWRLFWVRLVLGFTFDLGKEKLKTLSFCSFTLISCLKSRGSLVSVLVRDFCLVKISYAN